MQENMNFCYNCPRKCNKSKKTYCGVNESIRISKIMLHQWEEPCISFKNGSGTIFFSGCNLKCVYCQNYEISNSCDGKTYTVAELIKEFKYLESINADNINLVTPTPYVNFIIEALKIYKPKIPVVYNCSGYEDVGTLSKLSNLVDIYLTDCKYFSNELGKQYSNVNNYFENFKIVIKEMKKQQPNLIYNNDGKLLKGVIIRHLILPNHTDDSIKIAKWISTNIDNKTIISLMSQYTPCYKALQIDKLNRTLKPLEYKRVLEYYKNNTNFTNIYIQHLNSAGQNYIPNFKD